MDEMWKLIYDSSYSSWSHMMRLPFRKIIWGKITDTIISIVYVGGKIW